MEPHSHEGHTLSAIAILCCFCRIVYYDAAIVTCAFFRPDSILAIFIMPIYGFVDSETVRCRSPPLISILPLSKQSRLEG